jgi:hypothetical protein
MEPLPPQSETKPREIGFHVHDSIQAKPLARRFSGKK